VVALANTTDVIKDVANWLEKSSQSEFKPDLAWYQSHRRASKMFKDLAAEEKTAVLESRKPYMARVSWPWMVTAFEVKRTDVEAGYHFSTPGLIRTSKEGRKARAQFLKYAKEMQTRQHRTHVFMFYISGMHARIFRWDRTGTIVSKPIDLKTRPSDLLNCIFRLANLTREQQGYDATAELASTSDVMKLRAYKTDNRFLKEYRKFMLTSQSHFPIYKVYFRSNLCSICD
jgi:hypothetical protein